VIRWSAVNGVGFEHVVVAVYIALGWYGLLAGFDESLESAGGSGLGLSS
jgi:hypothetical protein